MLFRTPPENLHFVATFHLELSRFRECGCYSTCLRYSFSVGTLVWKGSQILISPDSFLSLNFQDTLEGSSVDSSSDKSIHQLRILAMYAAKTAKNSNFWMFWSITLLICHLFRSQQRWFKSKGGLHANVKLHFLPYT